MKRKEIQNLTLSTVFAAIILVMTFVPQVGYITIGTMALTLIHIPVLIGAFLLPKKYTVMLGFIFGIGSLIRAATTPTGILDPAFVNPLVSVLPRMVFAIAASYIFDLFKWFNIKVKHSEIYIFGFVTLITVFAMYYASDVIIGETGWNQKFVLPVVLLIISGFITTYYALISKKDKSQIVIPSTFLISTVFHTVVVLSALVIFERTFIEQYIPSSELLGFIYTVAVTNGLIEAILAVLIGTPIALALTKLQDNK